MSFFFDTRNLQLITLLLLTLSTLTAEKEMLEGRHSDLTLQQKERDEEHEAELKKERDEVARLKEQIEAMKANHGSEVERIIAEEKNRSEERRVGKECRL